MNVEYMTRKPNCFGDFLLKLKEKDSYFIYSFVECRCKNQKLNILAFHHDKNILAPVTLSCPECGYEKIVFNPEIHGWDGQNGDNCSMIGEGDSELITEEPLRVQVYRSYQGSENYEDLAEEGVENLEDYFDTFGMYGLDEKSQIVVSIDYECA